MTIDAVISDLDLSYTPPLGSPWDADPDRRPGLGRPRPLDTDPLPKGTPPG